MALPLLGILGIGLGGALATPHIGQYARDVRARGASRRNTAALAGLGPDATVAQQNRALLEAGLLDPSAYAQLGVTMRGQDLAHTRGLKGLSLEEQRLALQREKFGWEKNNAAVNPLVGFKANLPTLFAPQQPVDMNALKASISKIESGGRYDAVNPESGALGKYQIMPENLPTWGPQYLGREVSVSEFLNNPELQERLAGAVLGDYASNYGVAGAISRWHSGVGVDEAIAQGRHDGNISTAQYTASVLGDYATITGVKAAEAKLAGDPVAQEAATVRGPRWMEMDPEERAGILNTETSIGVMEGTIDYLDETTAAGRALDPGVAAQMQTEWQTTVLPELQKLFQAGAMQEAELRLFEDLAGNGFRWNQLTAREQSKMKGLLARIKASYNNDLQAYGIAGAPSPFAGFEEVEPGDLVAPSGGGTVDETINRAREQFRTPLGGAVPPGDGRSEIEGYLGAGQ